MTSDLPGELIDYISRFGGRCRDCADEDGVCPLPCGGSEKAIRWVLRAYAYGINHGFISPLAARPTPEAGSVPCTCHSCQSEIAVDIHIPDDVWAKISPKPVEGFKGGGLLCPQCIVDRLCILAEANEKIELLERDLHNLRTLIAASDDVRRSIAREAAALQQEGE